ncbi:MATE family efflux transporter [Streptomyces phaeoluteigriseus]|uniref:MATE family efflux transporter n=1 Tax=Streptomyces phaeoluteigriseus TaxID=114686 RepID=A0ABY4ZHN2_9ACTN|nr:lipid II flippase MurJ [Streptomyces phaeoluteigriseus]USQ88412.1 MATE family efflux transporter [Streptomyces phaeoluteigriseus]
MTVTPSRTPRADGDADGDVDVTVVSSARPTARHGKRPGKASGGSPEPPSASGGFLARAALVTAALSVAGSLLGLVRDQALARLFGAGRDTDAFLVAWTVPEFAATLLIEDGLAFALIPAFSMALARRAQGAGGDPVRALVAGTLPRLSLAFVAVGVLVAALAPQVVGALAPGLPDPALAVDCTRLTATCVLSFGLAGYCSAALRAHRRFVAPAAIYVAYNTGIVAGMFVLGERWGVRSAAVGVAVGGCLMVVVQLPSLWQQLRKRGAQAAGVAEEPRPLGGAVVATVLLFALCRQSQVLVERFLASQLPSGAISHLNYAQKVAQMPMILSLMVCTVTFPVVARALAEGDTERARDRVRRDLALAACVVLLGTAAVVACAPQMIELFFQRGAFTARDSAATAGVMRVYALGLLGQTLVGVLARSYFSTGRASWYPAGAMAVGIVVTSWLGALCVTPWGVYGIAAANAAGITVTALVLLAGTASGPAGTAPRRGAHRVPRSVPLHVPSVLRDLSRPVGAALVATPAGAFAGGRFGDPAAGLAAGTLTATGVFVLLGWALGAQGIASALRSVRSATRRLPHVRSR